MKKLIIFLHAVSIFVGGLLVVLCHYGAYISAVAVVAIFVAFLATIYKIMIEKKSEKSF